MSDSNPTPSHWFLRLVRRGRYAAAARARWADPATRDKLTSWHPRRWSDNHKHSHSEETRRKMADAARARHAQRLAPLRGPHGLGLVMPPESLRTRHCQRYESVEIPHRPTGTVADALWEIYLLEPHAKKTEHVIVEWLTDERLYLHGWRGVHKSRSKPLGNVKLFRNRSWDVHRSFLTLTTSDGVKRQIPVMLVEHPRNS